MFLKRLLCACLLLLSATIISSSTAIAGQKLTQEQKLRRQELCSLAVHALDNNDAVGFEIHVKELAAMKNSLGHLEVLREILERWVDVDEYEELWYGAVREPRKLEACQAYKMYRVLSLFDTQTTRLAEFEREYKKYSKIQPCDA